MKKTATPAIMLQGTASNVGKTLLCAAICRILKRIGYNPAPFKAQNMALNAFLSSQGEMSAAQAMQARACGIEPDPAMNPILLKPLGNCMSEVVVLGKTLGTMPYRDYISQKRKIWQTVRQAYHSLASEHDIMVLEGAGSPAEINLRRHDLVNMTMAREAAARVYLVADIDKGGAFAALAGTLTLLSRTDKKYVRGFVLNKFRGDKQLLSGALDRVSRQTGRPFLGIVPMIENCPLPAEDSLALLQYANGRPGTACLDVAILNLPFLTSFQELEDFFYEDDISLRLIQGEEDFGNPDLLIIPDTADPVRARRFLAHNGLDKSLNAYAANINTVHPGQIVALGNAGNILKELPYDNPGAHTCPIPSDRPMNALPGIVLSGKKGKLFNDDGERCAFLNVLRKRANLPPGKKTARDEAGRLDHVADIVEDTLDLDIILRDLDLSQGTD